MTNLYLSQQALAFSVCHIISGLPSQNSVIHRVRINLKPSSYGRIGLCSQGTKSRMALFPTYIAGYSSRTISINSRDKVDGCRLVWVAAAIFR